MADRDTEQLIDAYLDGELSVEQAAEVQKLLQSNPGLRRRYGPLLELLASPEPVEIPAGLRDRVLTAVHEHAARTSGVQRRPGQPNQPRTRVWLPRTGLIAASLMLFVAGWLTSRVWLDSGADQPVPARPQAISESSTVVLSPWVLNALAQSLATRGAAGSVTFVVQGAAIEVLTEPMLNAPAPFEIRPVIQTHPSRRRRSVPAERDEPENPFPMLLPIQRL
jgi:anti-sigma factor RsiW